MRYIDEYRDKEKILTIVSRIREVADIPMSFMEVCGGHTMSIQKFGLPSLLPENVRLLSGPGCPVCVTSRHYIDRAVAYSRRKDVIITTYGDLIRVPGSSSTLDKEKAGGADIRIVYSVLEALKIALENPDKKVVFLGIGFETTAPSSAIGILKAAKQGISNFYLYSAHKIMPPAMSALIDDGVKIDGYIAPGHVSTITGSGIYNEIPEKYGLAVVIAGFEPLDLVQAILMLANQVREKTPRVEIQYKRAVRPEGNLRAQEMMNEVFTFRDDWWRGLGMLENSGLAIRGQYADFDAEQQIEVEVEPTKEDAGCICGEILKGIRSPKECKLFARVCTPGDPVGACMVSNEGACQAYFRYNRD